MMHGISKVAAAESVRVLTKAALLIAVMQLLGTRTVVAGGEAGKSEDENRVAAVPSDTLGGSPASSDWPWPDSLDAVAAAPESHRILLENDRVRVLGVVIEPGDKEPAHTHRWSSVMMTEERSRIRYYGQAGELLFETSADADLTQAGQPTWIEPEGLHAVANIGEGFFRAVRVELKEPDDTLRDRAWMQDGADRPGVIRIFLSNGTLLMDSCWETFRLERWHRDGEAVVWSEDGREIRADLISVSDSELVVDLQLSDGLQRRRFVPAPVPYLCPDFPASQPQVEETSVLTYGCDDPDGGSFTFAVRYVDEAVEMRLPDRFRRSGPSVVPRVPAASGSKYEADGVLLWVAGERVRLDVDGASFGPCAEWPRFEQASVPETTDVWARARSEGVRFRALGQEPFWKLDVVPGRWMYFELVGAEPVATPVPDTITGADGTNVYHAVTEGHDLRVEIQPVICHDVMSGHEFEATVTVTLDGEIFRGCGRAP